MTTLSVQDAGANLAELLQRTADSHEPIQIAGKGAKGILVSDSDWQSIQETLHLLAVPGMRESIREGMAEPVERCAEEPGW